MNSKNMKRKVSTIISVLLMSVFMLTIVLNMNVNVVYAGENNIIYDVYIDSIVGFINVQASQGNVVGNALDFTIKEGDIVQWIYSDSFGDPLTIILKKVGGSESDFILSSETGPLRIDSLKEGKYESYLKKYPNLKHQEITVVKMGYTTPADVVEDKFKVSPTVRIIPINDEITKGQDGLAVLSLYNPGENSVSMNVEVRISQSVNLPVYGQGFTKLSDFEMYGKFDITSGETKDVYIQFKHIVGFDFAGSIDSNVKFTGKYYPGNNMDTYQPINFEHTFKVIKAVSTPVVTTASPTPTPTVTQTPIRGYTTPAESTGLYSFDNIQVDHDIQLCDVASDREREITGGSVEKNCGKTTFTLNDHPLDVFPSGGNSGKISDSEMVYVDVLTSGSMSLIPWRTQAVNTRWYDGSDNRLMFSIEQNANSISNRVGSYIGHFSHEINKKGKYYVDVEVVNWGSARVVFDVIEGNGPTPGPTVGDMLTPEKTPVVTYTARPVTSPVVTRTPKPGTIEDQDPGCWDSAFGFGMCAGNVITKTAVGLFVGIGKGIVTVLGG